MKTPRKRTHESPEAQAALARFLKTFSEAVNSRGRQEALAALQAAVDAGHPRAIYGLGTWYLHGRIVRKDIPRGLRLIARAARSGDPLAHFDMAVTYETGRGRKKAPRRAREHYLASADQGDTDAANELGRCYYWGIGGPVDYVSAVRWWKVAGKRGNVDSCRALSICYEYGDGVKRSPRLARAWESRADIAERKRRTNKRQ